MPVYISDSIYLSPEAIAADISPNAPRIGIQNITDTSTIFDSENQIATNPAQLTSTPSTAERWKESATNYHLWVTDTTGNTVDYVGIAAHSGLRGRQLTIRYTDALGIGDIYGPIIIVNNDPIFVVFEEITPLRVIVVIQGDEDFEMEVGIISVGKSVYLPRNIQVGHTPINYGRRTTKLISNSDNGQYLGQVVTKRSQQSSISIQNIDPNYFRDELSPNFVRPAEVLPFFFAWRPQKWPLEVGFVWTTDDFDPSNDLPNGFMKMSAPISGYVANEQS